MCNYVSKDKCLISKEICPYVYWCERRLIWKASKRMPENCSVKERYEAPKGQYKVLELRKGYLYVDVDGYAVKILNPFNFEPKYVELIKTDEGWEIKR